jgi:hypothetical protein
MAFNRALADAEIGRDVLAGVPRQHKRHDFALPRRQPADSDEAGRLFQVKSAMHSNLIAATLPN